MESIICTLLISESAATMTATFFLSLFYLTYQFGPLFYKHLVMFATMIVFAFFYGITQKRNDLVQQPNFQWFIHENQGDDRLIYQGCKRNKKLLFTMFLKCTRCLIYLLSIYRCAMHVKFLLRLPYLFCQCRWLVDLLRRAAYCSRVTVCLADLRKLPCNG